MLSLPQRPQTVFEIFKNTLLAFKATFFKLLPIALLYILSKAITIAFDFFIDESDISASGALILFTILVEIFFYFLELALLASLSYQMITLIIESKSLSLSSILKIGMKRALPSFGLFLLLGLFSLPGFAVIMISAKYFPALSLLQISGYSLACIYFTFLVVKLFFSTLLISIPGKGIWAAIEESSELVSGNFFRTAFLLFGLPALIFTLIAGSAFLVIGMTPDEHMTLIMMILGTFISVPILCYGAYIMVILHDLKQRKSISKADNVLPKNLNTI